ncbi:FAD-dependent oxidoreductase [bacterium]|nr:FAD-dependent oxidoreductase [bacterium]
MSPRVAIIGGGIAGLGCARILSKHMQVTLFESESRAGGHANTIEVNEDGKIVSIDTGFMVFNKTTYPNFYKLLCELETPIEPTDMSFSVQHAPTQLEWSGTGIKRALAKKGNLFNLRFLKMVSGVAKFNRMCLAVLEQWQRGERKLQTVEEATRSAGIGEELLQFYVLPMMSSLWSATPDVVCKFPIILLAKFMHSHGLLSVYGKLDWYTVKGGSQTYVKKMIEPFAECVQLKSPVDSVFLQDNGVTLNIKGKESRFDLCIFACHADQALRLLPLPLTSERKLLSKFEYSDNLATLHCDQSVMPKTKGNWASWNYRIKAQSGKLCSSTHYWMNSLQKLSSKQNYFVTLDQNPDINPESIKAQINYTHPIFTTESIQAQDELFRLNQCETNRLFFVGSYHGYGFHEDAYASSVNLCQSILRRSIA